MDYSAMRAADLARRQAKRAKTQTRIFNVQMDGRLVLSTSDMADAVRRIGPAAGIITDERGVVVRRLFAAARRSS